MALTLRQLTCFKHIETIEPITIGLSSPCYRVCADNQLFFVKQLTSNNEAMVSLNAALNNISPTVIYHDQHWLVTGYIDGDNLAENSKILDEKIAMACQLMAQCHQLNAKPTALAAEKISDELIVSPCFSPAQQSELLGIAKQLAAPLQQTTPLVCCHGDVNFSNILIDKMNNTYLVDFECAAIAPLEYDLAMFIAVNELTKDKFSAIIDLYEQYALIKVDPVLLNHYLIFCYFLNGLWYFTQQQNNPKISIGLGHQQWQKYNEMSAEQGVSKITLL